jgi:uncharacterized protein
MAANHLINETSPYLLQHAHNPVEWYPWSPEALEKAKSEDKPLLVSIGYSACHWCHVMERESFEDPTTAEIMNTHFVNIKIDREERPDLDHIYMDAVQAMTGSGGWPLNVFLTPDGKPFYGGTYFPPRPAFNRPSWKELLNSIAATFRSKRQELEDQSTYLTEHLKKANALGGKKASATEAEAMDPFGPGGVRQMFENLMKTADPYKGGFGGAPKFPQTFCIQFLLHYHYYTKEVKALDQACLSLDRMIQGGIYDQVGGGFARYSTDEDWLVPHFEKMLYDNALLVTVISEAFQLTQRAHYRKAVLETMDFISRELLSSEGGFYSALDADSEGVEGKYYVWDKPEIESVLKEDAPLFCTYYQVRDGGNWEGHNILHTRMTIQEFALLENRNIEETDHKLAACRKKLLEQRNKRVRPGLDDKILLGWNALMTTACCKAFAAFGIEEYKTLAIRNMDFLWTHFRGKGIYYFHHTYKDKRASQPGFLDDYACLVAALIQLQEITGDGDYLLKAKEITEWTVQHFSEAESGYFYFTHKDQRDIILRKKEIYDGATPSGNAVMSFNILFLSIIFDRPEWRERVDSNGRTLYHTVIQYPSSFGLWATLIQAITYGMIEVVITGEDPYEIHKDFLHNFIPNRVYQSATSRNFQFPLLKDKPLTESTLIFLCKDYSCQNPVTEVHELIALLENVHNF